MFQPTTDPDVLASYRGVISWAHAEPQFTSGAKAEFSRADNADAWIVAFAQTKGGIVVTREPFNPDTKKRVLIPNACQAAGVRTTDPFRMLRDLNAKFVLESL